MASTIAARASCSMASTSSAVAAGRRSAPASPLRRAVSVRATEEEKRGLDFQPSQRSGLGYTDEDSAGQSNIFAVEPKQYVAGSSRDNAANAQSTSVYAVSAGLVGLAAIVAAFSLGGANERGAGVDVAAAAGAAVPSGALSISKYAAKFTAPVAAATPAAPALVEE